MRKGQAGIEWWMNISLEPTSYITKSFGTCFLRIYLDMGKAPSKELSRGLLPMRSCVLQERIELQAPAGGSRREKVNPAYSSQLYPRCGYIHLKNYRGDKFVYRHGEHTRHTDKLAHTTSRKRLEIGRFFRGRRRTGCMRCFWRGLPVIAGYRPMGIPRRGDCSRANNSRHWKGVLFDC